MFDTDLRQAYHTSLTTSGAQTRLPVSHAPTRGKASFPLWYVQVTLSVEVAIWTCTIEGPLPLLFVAKAYVVPSTWRLVGSAKLTSTTGPLTVAKGFADARLFAFTAEPMKIGSRASIEGCGVAVGQGSNGTRIRRDVCASHENAGIASRYAGIATMINRSCVRSLRERCFRPSRLTSECKTNPTMDCTQDYRFGNPGLGVWWKVTASFSATWPMPNEPCELRVKRCAPKVYVSTTLQET